MSEFNITVNAGSSVKLKTAGKYCDRDILVTAEGSAGGDTLIPFLEGTLTKLESNATDVYQYACNENTIITEVVLPEATHLGSYAFDGCTSLKSVYLPKVEAIGNYVFYDCKALETIELPKCSTFNGYDFRNCTSLKTAKFPAVTKFGAYMFRGCTALEYIDFSGCTSVPTLAGTHVFQDVPATCQFRVPASLLDDWKATKYWSSFADQIVAVE